MRAFSGLTGSLTQELILRIFNLMASAAMLATLAAQSGSAQTPATAECAELFRGQRITIIVPNAPGGGFDLYARSIAPVLEQASGSSVRISYNSGGGGRAALVSVAEAGADELVMLIDSTIDVLSMLALGDNALSYGSVRILGVMHTDPDAWVGRAGIDIGSPETRELVASASSAEANFAGINLAALAMRLQARVVSGYSGSADTTAAVMRGETDFAPASLTTARKTAASSDLEILMVLSEGAYPAVPDAPYLAGEGGIVWQRSASLPEAERAELQALARQAVNLSTGSRALFASASLRPAAFACLAAATETTLMSDAFRQAAEAVGRPVSPMTAQDAEALVVRTIAALAEAAPLFDQFSAELKP
jgi:tripartite-type tricarboxylate transporter receptor subunit TctC